jgi:hypothetical protein
MKQIYFTSMWFSIWTYLTGLFSWGWMSWGWRLWSREEGRSILTCSRQHRSLCITKIKKFRNLQFKNSNFLWGEMLSYSL